MQIKFARETRVLSSSPGVYIFANKITGDSYIGSAVNLRQRYNSHKYYLSNNKHHSSFLQRAWNKYGETAFEFRPVVVCEKSELLRYEQGLIDKLKPRYNTVMFAGNTLGYKHTQESKMKIAEAAKNASPETRAKKIAALIGRPVSPETRMKMSKAQSKRRGFPLSEEHKRNISNSLRGKLLGPITEEHRKKLSLAKAGIPRAPHSLETRERQRQAAVRRYARERLVRSITALGWL